MITIMLLTSCNMPGSGLPKIKKRDSTKNLKALTQMERELDEIIKIWNLSGMKGPRLLREQNIPQKQANPGTATGSNAE